MNKSTAICLLASVTMCAGGWARDIPFKAMFTGTGVVALGVPCDGMKTSIDTNGIATDLGQVRTIQTHCTDPKGTDPLSFTDGVCCCQ